MLDHFAARGHMLQRVGDVFTDLAEHDAAAARNGASLFDYSDARPVPRGGAGSPLPDRRDRRRTSPKLSGMASDNR
jgi:hypothetical protein